MTTHPTLRQTVLDTEDPRGLAEFYRQLLGLTYRPGDELPDPADDWLVLNDADGRTRIAVNLRLAEPDTVAGVPLQCFDGLHSFDDLPRDGRRVRDVWF
jgi:hypothetical protein